MSNLMTVQKLILSLTAIAIFACSKGKNTDSATSTIDHNDEQLCFDCNDMNVDAFLNRELTSLPVNENAECQGICVRAGNSAQGRCVAPSEPNISCDWESGGYLPENVDSQLATEGFTINVTSQCDECDQSMETCSGFGDPLDKRSQVFVPATGDKRNELFVFLGGSGGTCDNHKWITAMAGLVGYDAICLAYVNSPSVNDICLGSIINDPESTCGKDFRRENLYGQDEFATVQIGPRNSVVGRLTALLKHLDNTQPEQGFGQYLSGNDIIWSKLAISGYSQGGGNAGILSQDHEMARAIFFSKGIGSTYYSTGESCESLSDCSSDAEACEQNQCYRIEPSPYYTEPRATPGEKSFGFIHEMEFATTYSLDAWTEWGMDICGGPASIENHPEDFLCGNILSTNAAPSDNPTNYHGAMGGDGAMPKTANDFPLNHKAIMYMMSKR